MDNQEILEKLRKAIVIGDQETAVNVTNQAIQVGIGIKEILNEGMIKAAEEVGKLYEDEEYFLPDLLITGDVVASVMDILKPLLEKNTQESKGKILIGTVEGDIHDIGKTLVVTLLRGQGYDILDLGIDISPDIFVNKAREFKPDIIGLSGLLTSSISKMHETIIALKKDEIPSKVIIGGGIVSKNSCAMIGADDCAKDGWEGVKKINQIMKPI